MQDLTVSLLQTQLFWEDKVRNLSMFEQRLDEVPEISALAVLPEMFNTGFTMNAPALAETMAGPTVQWITAQAQARKIDIAGSAIIEEKGAYYNRLLWARANGELLTYDKRHLFRMGGEHQVYAAGKARLLVELQDWRILPLICYDLRFPVWSRNTEPMYDLAIYVANWPAKRGRHWRALLTARAIENQCYVIGVNRVGVDGHGQPHAGDSLVIDPRGEILFHQFDTPCIHTATLSGASLQTYRQAFPAWHDRDEFHL